jgi:acyl-CoA reductase-like NAD-dependent aldehyde dehydrogenase
MNLEASQTLENWQALSHRQRCRRVGRVRHELAVACDELASLCRSPQRPDLLDTITAELIPLCAALKRIERSGHRILRTQRFGIFGRPVWLWGVRSTIQRVARGKVLVLAAWNYPILLPGAQVAQALAAGNRVYLKPAPGCEAVTSRLAELFIRAGIPEGLLSVLPSDTQAAIDRIQQGVDLVVLTGSSGTGRAVMRQCAEKLTPAILELSGSDAVIVGKHANLAHVAKAVRFGLTFNSGATCIGPRRIMVESSVRESLIEQLRAEFTGAEPMQVHPAAAPTATKIVNETLTRGATNLLASDRRSDVQNSAQISPIIFDPVGADWPVANCDVFAPIASMLTFTSDDQVVSMVNECRYRLAASVFGDARWAKSIAHRLDVGTVTINDLIFPTADPRLPFGGRGESGFGVTRGDLGLFDMTVPRVISHHRGRLFIHLMKRTPSDLDTLAGALTLTHGRLRDKWAGLRRIWTGVKFNMSARSASKTSSPSATETKL